jgi:hypothetical protein
VEPKVYYIESSGKETGWVKVRDLKNHPFSKANLKIIDQLFDPQLNIFI